MIHLGTHDYSMAKGRCKEVVDQGKALVEEVCCAPLITKLTIVLVTSNIFLSKHLFNEDGERANGTS